eukprot:scaffold14308_cov68-Phaeocystis_antarctica.AAC.7
MLSNGAHWATVCRVDGGAAIVNLCIPGEPPRLVLLRRQRGPRRAPRNEAPGAGRGAAGSDAPVRGTPDKSARGEKRHAGEEASRGDRLLLAQGGRRQLEPLRLRA